MTTADLVPPSPERTEDSAPVFCESCGARCDMIPTGRYSRTTGKALLRPVCPTGTCEHEGCWHDWEYRFFRADRCRKCGEEGLCYD